MKSLNTRCNVIHKVINLLVKEYKKAPNEFKDFNLNFEHAEFVILSEN